MPYIQRNEAGEVTGVFAQKQSGYAEEFVEIYHLPLFDSPQVVTRFQARAALMLTPSANAFDNMLAEVDAFMTHQDTDPMARLAWTEAQEFYRQSPTVLAMAAVLNLSDAQLDQLFTLAATIQA